MAQEYITKADFTNINFNKTPEPVRQLYIDQANQEIEDLAQRLGVMNVLEIRQPIQYQIRRYGINYAYSLYAQDLIGANEIDIGENDLYKDLFERSQYLINQILPDITKEMFTGKVETREDRSVSFGHIYRS